MKTNLTIVKTLTFVKSYTKNGTNSSIIVLNNVKIGIWQRKLQTEVTIIPNGTSTL